VKNPASLLSALLLLAGPSMAQDALVRDFRGIRACAGDVEKLCPGVLPGEGRINACMKWNISKLSADCVDTMQLQVLNAR